jgi:hypothetical protein
MNIRDDIQIDSIYKEFTEPDQGHDETKTKYENTCNECGKSLDYEGDINDMCQCYSPCCGAKMYHDCDLCPVCHEHV